MVDSEAPNTRDEWVVVVPPLPRRHADTLWDEWRTHAGVELQSEDIRVDLIRADGGDHRRYCVRGLMLVDTDQLVARLRQMGGEIGHIVEEHQADHGDILLHLLVADLRRFAERTFDGGPSELLDRLLRLLTDAFDQADAVVANAIAVSFVEDSCLWKPEVSEFVWAARSGVVARSGGISASERATENPSRRVGPAELGRLRKKHALKTTLR